MSIPNKTKIPLLIVSGVFLGLIIVTILMSSTISDGNVNPKNNNIELYDTPYQVFQPTVPTKVWFADEKVPIEFFDVYESLDRELIINTYRHSSTILYVKRAKRYFPTVAQRHQTETSGCSAPATPSCLPIPPFGSL